MAAAIDVGKLSSILECKICLEKFNVPKMLACNHLFCKGCLEEIAKFTEDGSAIIECPLRCKKQTFIGGNRTIDDLGSSYEIKAVLEAVQATDKSLVPVVRCSHSTNCEKEISFYCCGRKMCTSCHSEHNRTQESHQGKTNVVLNENKEKLNVLCTKHSSKCSHVCVDSVHSSNYNFLCMYCKNREHRGHTIETIEYQSTKIREALVNDFKKVQKIRELHKTTAENVQKCWQKLDDLIRARKVERMSAYLDLLNKEEQAIKREFGLIWFNHIQQYPVTIDPTYYDIQLEKDEIELVLEKAEIINTICSQDLNNASLRNSTVSLSDDFTGEHPLGQLKSIANEPIPIAFTEMELPSPTLTFTFTESLHVADDYAALLSQMKELLQPEAGASKIHQDSDIHHYSHIADSFLDVTDSVAEKEYIHIKSHEKGKSQESTFHVSKTDQDSDIIHHLQSPELSPCASNIESCSGDVTDSVMDKKSIEEVKSQVVQPTHINREEKSNESPHGVAAAIDPEVLDNDFRELNERGINYVKELIWGNKEQKLKCMLEKSVHILYLRSVDGMTPFLFAAEYNKVNIMELLAFHGTNIYETDDWGKTALHIVTRNNYVGALNWLLAHWNSYVDVKNNLGVTPLELAKKHNHTECIAELQKWMKDHPPGGVFTSISRMFWGQ